jgi:hypothetical protein
VLFGEQYSIARTARTPRTARTVSFPWKLPPEPETDPITLPGEPTPASPGIDPDGAGEEVDPSLQAVSSTETPDTVGAKSELPSLPTDPTSTARRCSSSDPRELAPQYVMTKCIICGQPVQWGRFQTGKKERIILDRDYVPHGCHPARHKSIM